MTVKINGRKIGNGYPPYIVAELSANHNGSLDNALSTITTAKKEGADAIKLQTYTPDTITINSELPDFKIKEGLWEGTTLFELYQKAHTPFEWHKELFDHARKIGITCFSTPFDETAVDLLEDLNAPAYKIASFEAIDIPLIKYVAQTGKPMIISTGMADLAEIQEALEAARSYGSREVILLHCVSSYPAPLDQCNLKTIPDLANRFGVVSGLSDHSLGTNVALGAVALGAAFIEKHFILDRKVGGPDSTFSIEPHELNILCQQSKDIWSAIGKASYEPQEAEQSNIAFRRSIYFVEDLKKGELITEESIKRIRPGYGLKPKYFDSLLGRKVNCDVQRGQAVNWNLIYD